MIFNELGIKLSDYTHGYERGVYYSEFYENTKDFLQNKIDEKELKLKDGKLAQLTERFLRDPTLPTTPSLDLANAFLEVDSLKEALRWAERAVFYAQDESTVLQPKYLPPCEFAQIS